MNQTVRTTARHKAISFIRQIAMPKVGMPGVVQSTSNDLARLEELPPVNSMTGQLHRTSTRLEIRLADGYTARYRPRGRLFAHQPGEEVQCKVRRKWLSDGWRIVSVE